MVLNDIFEQQRVYAEQYNIPILREEEVDVFCQIVERYQPKSILEIGTAIGYSTLLLAKHMSEKGKVTTIELDEERRELACTYIRKSPYANQITSLQGDGIELLKNITGTFDFVFLDGPKGQYSKQLELVMPHLSKNAIILADNVLFRGYVRGNIAYPRRFRTIVARLREYLAMVENKELFETDIIPLGDGMSVSRWKGTL